MLHRRIAAPTYVSECSLTYVAAPNVSERLLTNEPRLPM
jgi:hypothetical protein